MIETSDVYFFWVEEPLHVGSGSSTGAVDLPIQRERHTGFPMVQYSGIKGAIRSHCRDVWKRQRPQDAAALENGIFGPDTSIAEKHGGAASFSQMRIALFPVRSLYGLFAWITCPTALANLTTRLGRAGCPLSAFPSLTDAPALSTVWVTEQSPVTAIDAQPNTAQQQWTVLEEFAFKAVNNTVVGQIAKWLSENVIPAGYAFWKGRLYQASGNQVRSHLIVMNDEDFAYFVEQSTMVVSRNAIDPETSVVKDTGLWTEEALPPDTLLYSVVHFSKPESGAGTPPALRENEETTGVPAAKRVQIMLADALTDAPIVQLGGNASVGCGLTRTVRVAGTPLPLKSATIAVTAPAVQERATGSSPQVLSPSPAQSLLRQHSAQPAPGAQNRGKSGGKRGRR